MRQVSIEETRAVGGAACSDLTMSVGLTGVSLSGSLGDWASCFSVITDAVSAFGAHYSTGIPYGEPHVG